MGCWLWFDIFFFVSISLFLKALHNALLFSIFLSLNLSLSLWSSLSLSLSLCSFSLSPLLSSVSTLLWL